MAIRNVICIETGPVTTKVCKIDYGKPNGKIHKAIEFTTPEGAVEDGYIRDKDSFLHVLKREMKAARFGKGYLAFTVNSSRILSREVTVPLVSHRLLPGLLESGKEEYFPMDVSKHELAYSLIELDKEQKTRRIMLYAVPLNLLKQYDELAGALSCKLVQVDFAGNSVYQWIRHAGDKSFPEPINMMVQIGEQSTVVTILENGKMALQRNINYGTRSILEVVKEAYKTEEKELSLEEASSLLSEETLVQSSFADNEHLKSQRGLTTESDTLQKARFLVTDAIRPLIVNITRMMEFYATKNKTGQIEIIRVGGSGLCINGLISLMKNEIDLPVEALDQVLIEQLSKKVNPRHASELICCFGATLSPINYIGIKFCGRNPYNLLAGILLLIAIVVAIKAVGQVKEVRLAYQTALTEQAALEKERDDKLWIREEREKQERYRTMQNEILSMNEASYTNNEQLLEIIAALEENLPSATVVHSFSSQGDLLTMSITVENKAQAERLLIQMKQIPYFSEVNLSGITETEPEPGLTEVSFSLTCTYQKAKEAQNEEE